MEMRKHVHNKCEVLLNGTVFLDIHLSNLESIADDSTFHKILTLKSDMVI
jgi:hypothetical protein